MRIIILEIMGTLVGIVLGAVLAYLFSRKGSMDDLNKTLLTEYKNISQELAEILKDILTLSLKPEKISAEKCKEIDISLGDFVFRHFLVLPQPVLEEINCLHVCLTCGGKKAYIVKHEGSLPVLQPRASDDDIKNILEDVAIVTTRRTLFDIYKKYGKLPQSVILKCQARHVMIVMNEHWNLSRFNEWAKSLPKTTIAKRRNCK